MSKLIFLLILFVFVLILSATPLFRKSRSQREYESSGMQLLATSRGRVLLLPALGCLCACIVTFFMVLMYQDIGFEASDIDSLLSCIGVTILLVVVCFLGGYAMQARHVLYNEEILLIGKPFRPYQTIHWYEISEMRIKNQDGIVEDANRMAEDVYAGSVMYTDEALHRVQDIMQDAMDSVREICDKMNDALAQEKSNVRRDQSELKSHLEDLRDTNKYMNLIEQRNKEIAKERAKREQEEEEATSVYASVKPEIKINEEYFEKNGIPLETEEPEEEPEKNTGETGAEIKVNLDAE